MSAVAPLLYARRVAVAVDDLLVDGLRVQFSVVKTLTKNPNTCDITITNLGETTRRRMAARRAKVVLSAGYQDTISQIFSGDARTTDHLRKGPDWETHIQCGDGEVAYQHARVSESFSPGTTVAQVIERLARQSGLGLGNVMKAIAAGGFRGNLEQFAMGYVAHGRAAAELDRVLRTAGLEWSIQDGNLQVLKPDAAADQRAVLLTPETGLVGSPEHGAPDKKGKASTLKAKTLLQPQIKPGGQVEIRARGIQGHYRVEKVTHSGDTAGGGWYTELEGRPL